jgi:predicted transcriptional regulator
LKRRPNFFILMQLLDLMIQEPRGPTRLAQAANLNYKKCGEFLAILSMNQLVYKDVREGRETYSANAKGKDVYWRWVKLFEDVKVS